MDTNNGMVKTIATFDVNGKKTLVPLTKRAITVFFVAFFAIVFTLACVIGSLLVSPESGTQNGLTKTTIEVRCQDSNYAFTHSKCERYNR